MHKMLIVISLFGTLTIAAQYDATVTVGSKLGFDTAYTLANGLITLTLVPKVGGRPMQYNLSTHAFLHVEETEFTVTPQTSSNGEVWNGGGFLTWPVPQANWPNSWPPPLVINQGKYTHRTVSSSADSAVVEVTSGTENTSGATGLVCRKVFTVYNGSSRVKVDARMINKATTARTWSIRNVAQCWADHQGAGDYKSMWIFFPKGSSVKDSTRGFWPIIASTPMNQFKTNYMPGVVAMQYNNGGGQIGAHPTEQWIAYQDSARGYTFVQKGTFQPGGTYPEYGGAVVVLWMGDWLEAEMCAPQKNIAFNDSLQYITDMYSTKLAGPIADVNNAGVIKTRLAVTTNNGNISGEFGVFHVGKVKMQFNTETTPAKEFDVSPLTTFKLSETVTLPSNASGVSLLLYSASGKFIDTLDAASFTPAGVLAGFRPMHGVSRFYMNGTSLVVCSDITVDLAISTVNGRTIYQRTVKPGTHTIPVNTLTRGMYFVSLKGSSVSYKGQMLIP